MYSVLFESEGMWVAGAATPGEAIQAVDELKPDVVVTDVGFDGQPLGFDFIDVLKQHERTAHTPVILVSARAPSSIPAETRAQADVCLFKPVPPADLVAHVNRVLTMSRALRLRNEALLQKAVSLRDRSNALVARSREIDERASAVANGSCPRCGQALQWIERGTIDRREYDYYHWCANRCGLYCFDRAGRTWVKLAG
jgi:CheY-like chemotaxis protein/endogenous inhibitor of DNA gyrase (YacG/DUF329 family)